MGVINVFLINVILKTLWLSVLLFCDHASITLHELRVSERDHSWVTDDGNQITLRKPMTCTSLTNFITKDCIEYT